MIKTMLMVALTCALSSCAILPSLGDIEHANDAAIAAWRRAGCAFPLSAIQRNPDIIPALNVLCKGGAQAADVVGK